MNISYPFIKSNKEVLLQTDIGDIPFSPDEWEGLLSLPESEFKEVLHYCECNVIPYMTLKTYNKRHTSYGLKHNIEKRIGFYVSNGTVKLALAQLRIHGMRIHSISFNLCYPLSEKFWRCTDI